MQPQPFIQTVRPDIGDSRFILTNDAGLAAGLAWELKRSDIILFDHKGELAYGLGYPDAAGRFVSAGAFRHWLAVNRQLGNVSLILRVENKDDATARQLPVADVDYREGDYRLVQYRRQP
jgi:4-amino-4-deoxy-L-arabinose transferase